MSHTPGPWKVFDGWGSSRFAPVIVDSIPDIDGKFVGNCICHIASTNDDAVKNAHLIAAAPDLLATLEKAVENYGQPGGPWNVPSDPGGWLDMARQAIRKAKGGDE
jgi:hypothetical protein